MCVYLFICLSVCLSVTALSAMPVRCTLKQEGLGLNYKQIMFFFFYSWILKRMLRSKDMAVFAHLEGCFDYFGILQSRQGSKYL